MQFTHLANRDPTELSMLVLKELRRPLVERLRSPPMNAGGGVSRVCLPDLPDCAHQQARLFEDFALHRL